MAQVDEALVDQGRKVTTLLQDCTALSRLRDFGIIWKKMVSWVVRQVHDLLMR